MRTQDLSGGAMEHFVKIRSIPNGLEFPESLQGRIQYDAAHKQLAFRGFMCKSEYDQLLELSPHVDYQVAIGELFQLSTVSNSPQLRKFGHVLAALTIACLLLAGFVWWTLLRTAPADTNGSSANSINNTSSMRLSILVQDGNRSLSEMS